MLKINEKLKTKVEKLSDSDGWNHYYEFPGGIKTRQVHVNSPGYCLQKWPRIETIIGRENFKEKTIVDVGCSDGYFSIYSSFLGAKVTGFDLDPIRIERANLAKEILNANNTEFKCDNVFNVKYKNKFDYCFALGFLHRVDDILTCIKNLSKLSDSLLLEYKTYVSNEDICFDGKKGTKKKIAGEYNTLYGIPTNVFVENRLCELGYTEFIFDLDTESRLNFKRTMCLARRGKSNE
jgi:SAM-dependent methyltransferase